MLLIACLLVEWALGSRYRHEWERHGLHRSHGHNLPWSNRDHRQPSCLQATLVYCTLTGGTTLFLQSASTAVDTYQPVNVHISDVTMVSSGIGFQGYFPRRTRLLMKEVMIQIDQSRMTTLAWNSHTVTEMSPPNDTHNFSSAPSLRPACVSLAKL